jgi:Putative prokaryotic signal transducing protein
MRAAYHRPVTPLLPLTTVHGSFSAHVLAARLQSEGIDVELRGAVGAAYGLTVGDMARVDLFVPEDQMEDARLVLMASEIDNAMEMPPPPSERARHAPTWPWAVAIMLIVVAAVAPVLRWIAD